MGGFYKDGVSREMEGMRGRLVHSLPSRGYRAVDLAPTAPAWSSTVTLCCDAQGDLSLDQYDDSQHSRGSFPGGGIGSAGGHMLGLGVAITGSGGGIGGTGAPSLGGMRFPSPAPPPPAPWGSGMGGVGKNGPDGVVHGGIWMPTPGASNLTGSFFSLGNAGGDEAGRGGSGAGGSVAGAPSTRRGGAMESGNGVAAGRFFVNDEPRCDRCSTSEVGTRSQVR